MPPDAHLVRRDLNKVKKEPSVMICYRPATALGLLITERANRIQTLMNRCENSEPEPVSLTLDARGSAVAAANVVGDIRWHVKASRFGDQFAALLAAAGVGLFPS